MHGGADRRAASTEVYDLGVRDMELVNKFDNALGGVAGDSGTTGVVVNNGNRIETGRYWQMGPCADAHNHDKEQLAGAERRPTATSWPATSLRAAAARRDPDLRPGAALQRAWACPTLGEHLVRADDAAQAMIIDPDHLSVTRPPAAARRGREARVLGRRLLPQLEHARTRSRGSCASAAS